MANLTRTGRSVSVKRTNIYGSGGTSTTLTYQSTSRVSSDTKSGSKNPNWRSAVRRVFQAGTPYSRTFTLFGFVSGKVFGEFHPSGSGPNWYDYHEVGGQLFIDAGPSLPSLPVTTHLDVQARVNFLSKCRKTSRAFQGGVFLGELREAIHMIVRPASALRRGISRYSSAAKKAARRAKGAARAKALAGTWLEYSYGWKPLFNDIDSGMAALADTNHILPEVISGTGKDEWYSNRQSFTTVASGVFIGAKAAFITRNRGRVRYLGCVAWESENRASNWQSHWGLTLSDFAPTIWELIPYSFLVDYFSNVGAIIDASSFGAVGLRWGIISNVREASVLLGPYKPVWSSSSVTDSTESASLGLSPLSRYSFTRSLVNKVDVGIADIQFRIPGLSDWRKWANMAALATERVL